MEEMEKPTAGGPEVNGIDESAAEKTNEELSAENKPADEKTGAKGAGSEAAAKEASGAEGSDSSEPVENKAGDGESSTEEAAGIEDPASDESGAEKSDSEVSAKKKAPNKQSEIESPEVSKKESTAAGESEAKVPAAEEKKPAVLSVELLEAELRKEQHKIRYGKVLKSTIFSLLVVAAIAVLITVLFVPVLQISGTSMTETLQDRDIVAAVSISKYKKSDVIAFYYNNNILIKRVIATAGDWVNIDEEGNVYVNDELLNEPYVNEKAFGQCNITLPYQVPAGKCFVMGDHRATSIDSRNTAVGCIGNEMVVGKIVVRVWPLSGIGFVK